MPDLASDAWLAVVPWSPTLDGGSPSTPLEPLMTLHQLAAYLNIAPVTLYRHVKQGLVPSMRIGGVHRFRRSVIEAWLSAQGER